MLRQAGESARDGIEANMNLVDKVARTRDAGQRRAGVHIVEPAVELFVAFQGLIPASAVL